MKVKPWTAEERALFAKGLSDPQIAEKTGRTLSSVANKRSYMKSTSNGGSEDNDFTAQEKRIILTTSSNKEAAERIGATEASVKEMREWLGQQEEPQVRMAAKPKVQEVDIDDIEDQMFNNKLYLRFGSSTMILDKDEVGSIQIQESGVLILKS